MLHLIYDENFSENSFGFRPRRVVKDAIRKAESYINEGYTWVVDIDLEKFFDKVNHDILMYKLSKGIKAVSYTHLTLPTKNSPCRSRWSPYH